MSKKYYVYILTNNSGTLYVGVTNNLERRYFEHLLKRSTFTARYRLNKLIYAEEYKNVNEAVAREKQVKGWRRNKKIDLIRRQNPGFRDLLTGKQIPRLRSE